MSVVAAGVFKARCLELMDEVARTGEEVVITKFGRPVARLVSLEAQPAGPLFGRVRHAVVAVTPDAFAPCPELWSALDE
jgi:prevent-host-death family protein